MVENSTACRRDPKTAESSERKLDREWVELILAARELGITAEEIRNFFQEIAACGFNTKKSVK